MSSCPSCKKEIDSYAKRCPYCTSEIRGMFDFKKSCPACKKEIDSNAKRCPYCTSELFTETGIGENTTGAAVYGLFVGGLLGSISYFFTDYWILLALGIGIGCAWLCYTFGLNKEQAR